MIILETNILSEGFFFFNVLVDLRSNIEFYRILFVVFFSEYKLVFLYYKIEFNIVFY